MKELIKSKYFLAGVFIGILLIILLNIFLPPEGCDFYNLCNYGFPLAYYQIGYGEGEGTEQIKKVLWLGAMVNFSFALLISFITGLSFDVLLTKESDSK